MCETARSRPTLKEGSHAVSMNSSTFLSQFLGTTLDWTEGGLATMRPGVDASFLLQLVLE